MVTSIIIMSVCVTCVGVISFIFGEIKGYSTAKNKFYTNICRSCSTSLRADKFSKDHDELCLLKEQYIKMWTNLFREPPLLPAYEGMRLIEENIINLKSSIRLERCLCRPMLKEKSDDDEIIAFRVHSKCVYHKHLIKG